MQATCFRGQTGPIVRLGLRPGGFGPSKSSADTLSRSGPRLSGTAHQPVFGKRSGARSKSCRVPAETSSDFGGGRAWPARRGRSLAVRVKCDLVVPESAGRLQALESAQPRSERTRILARWKRLKNWHMDPRSGCHSDLTCLDRRSTAQSVRRMRWRAANRAVRGS